MRDQAAPSPRPKLRLDRAVPWSDERVQRGEDFLLRSAAEALEEVRANLGDVHGFGGTPLVLLEPGDVLSADELKRRLRDLAKHGWDQGRLEGESPLAPLTRERDGWVRRTSGEAPMEVDALAEEPPVPRLVLALNVLDMLAKVMGPTDSLAWPDDRGQGGADQGGPR